MARRTVRERLVALLDAAGYRVTVFNVAQGWWRINKRHADVANWDTTATVKETGRRIQLLGYHTMTECVRRGIVVTRTGDEQQAWVDPVQKSPR